MAPRSRPLTRSVRRSRTAREVPVAAAGSLLHYPINGQENLVLISLWSMRVLRAFSLRSGNKHSALEKVIKGQYMLWWMVHPVKR